MFPEVAMLSHAQVWGAIDALAQKYGMTPSGLARKAGLDATTFNKSKRASSDGRLRWPSQRGIHGHLTVTAGYSSTVYIVLSLYIRTTTTL